MIAGESWSIPEDSGGVPIHAQDLKEWGGMESTSRHPTAEGLLSLCPFSASWYQHRCANHSAQVLLYRLTCSPMQDPLSLR